MILVLNGSPNIKSKTLSIVNELLINSTEEIVTLNAYDLNIISCDDCKYCSKVIGCSKKDDMDSFISLLEKANTFIIASPIYFGSLSDQIMKVINRFQRYFGQKYDQKDNNIPSFDNIILVTSQGSDKLRFSLGAYETLNILTLLFNPKFSGKITNTNSDFINPVDDIKTQEQIKEISKKITL